MTTRDRIATTTWARTAIALAATLRPHELTGVLKQAEDLRIFDLHELQPLLDRYAHRPGGPAFPFRPSSMPRWSCEVARALPA